MQQPLKEFQQLVQFAEQHFDGLQRMGELNTDLHEKDERAHFTLFYRLYLFKRLLESVKGFDLLLKIVDLIPSEKSQYEQLCILNELCKHLHQLNEREIQEVHKQMMEISKYEPGTESEVLPELIKIQGSFHFFSSLQRILMWPIEDVLRLCQIFPSFNYIQLLLLTRFKELPPADLWDITGLVFPASQIVPQELIPSPASLRHQQNTQNSAQNPTQAGPTLFISGQPPDRCIYKRNVKPAPVVIIEGHNNQNDGSLFLVPVLIRCDNMEEVTKLMTGNEPTKVMATKTIAFKKLKITQTSHQLNETLFCLKFELRKYFGPLDSTNYQVLHSCTTNPFAVCSHSTQLKTRPKALPVITEMIPPQGSPAGGTKVAILGNNFEESPTARVRFDEVEIRPTFHGPKTLIVQTPKHVSGTVKVQICNESNQWSTSVGIFTFIMEENETGTAYKSTPQNFVPIPLRDSIGPLDEGFILGDNELLNNYDYYPDRKSVV